MLHGIRSVCQHLHVPVESASRNALSIPTLPIHSGQAQGSCERNFGIFCSKDLIAPRWIEFPASIWTPTAANVPSDVRYWFLECFRVHSPDTRISIHLPFINRINIVLQWTIKGYSNDEIGIIRSEVTKRIPLSPTESNVASRVSLYNNRHGLSYWYERKTAFPIIIEPSSVWAAPCISTFLELNEVYKVDPRTI